MRIVGRRQSTSSVVVVASADALRAGLAVVDAAATFGWATSTGQCKGAHRFSSFEAMEEHRVACLAQAMAERAKSMTSTTH